MNATTRKPHVIQTTAVLCAIMLPIYAAIGYAVFGQ